MRLARVGHHVVGEHAAVVHRQQHRRALAAGRIVRAVGAVQAEQQLAPVRPASPKAAGSSSDDHAVRGASAKVRRDGADAARQLGAARPSRRRAARGCSTSGSPDACTTQPGPMARRQARVRHAACPACQPASAGTRGVAVGRGAGRALPDGDDALGAARDLNARSAAAPGPTTPSASTPAAVAEQHHARRRAAHAELRARRPSTAASASAFGSLSTTVWPAASVRAGAAARAPCAPSAAPAGVPASAALKLGQRRGQRRAGARDERRRAVRHRGRRHAARARSRCRAADAPRRGTTAGTHRVVVSTSRAAIERLRSASTVGERGRRHAPRLRRALHRGAPGLRGRRAGPTVAPATAARPRPAHRRSGRRPCPAAVRRSSGTTVCGGRLQPLGQRAERAAAPGARRAAPRARWAMRVSPRNVLAAANAAFTVVGSRDQRRHARRPDVRSALTSAAARVKGSGRRLPISTW